MFKGVTGLGRSQILRCWQSYCFLTSLLQHLAKNVALLVQNFVEIFFGQISDFVSGYFKAKKTFLFPKMGGGGVRP